MFIMCIQYKCKGYVLHIFGLTGSCLGGGLTEAKSLAEVFERYKEWYPHSELGYRSQKEYLQLRSSNGLSDNRCLEI